MSKRRRSPSLPLGREDLNHSRRELKALFALDELFLRVLSFLPARDLARAQGVSRHWERMALDPQLWKQLYLGAYEWLFILLTGQTAIRTLTARVLCTHARKVRVVQVSPLTAGLAPH